jgi:hypothetical protein
LHIVWIREAMKETPRMRITVTSSLNKISKDQLGNNSNIVMVVRGETLLPTSVLYSKLLDRYFNDDVNIFISTSDICFMRGPFRYLLRPARNRTILSAGRHATQTLLSSATPRLSYSVPQT